MNHGAPGDCQVLRGIHVAHWGTSGPRVVMVHGGVQGSPSAGERNFAAQRSLSEEGWQLIVPDRPGHGQSADPGRGDDAEADAIWVAQLLGEGAHLVGHSFGGLVALAAAKRRPGAVLSLVLIEPGAHKIALRSPAVRKFLVRMIIAVGGPFASAVRARRVMKLLGIPKEAFGRSDAELVKMGGALRRGKFPSRAKIETDLAALRSAKIPLLVISGDWSDAFLATGEAVAEKGGGEHHVIPWDNHFPQWAGASFNRVLSDFWKASVTSRDAKLATENGVTA